MEYSLNLLRPNGKSKFRIYCGVLLILLAIFFIVFRSPGLKNYDWIYFGVALFFGIFYLLNGLGIFSKLFNPKIYVKITDDSIYAKLNKKEPEIKTNWAEVKSVHFKNNELSVTSNDNSSFQVTTSLLSSEKLQEFLEIIKKKANEYNILFVIK